MTFLRPSIRLTTLLKFFASFCLFAGTGVTILGSSFVYADPINVQLRWHHQFQFAGYYAAIEKGYYRKAGLEVILHEGAPGKTPIQEVLKGNCQYGEANSEVLLARLRGAPLVALASIFQHSPSVLLARKEAGISSPEDLIGKNVMMMDPVIDADFVAMFNNEGINISGIHIIPSSYNIQDLVDGKVAAFNSYISNEPYFLKLQGIEYTILNPRNYGVDFYSDIFFTTEEELQHHPERVKAFREATLEGWRYAMAHQQEMIDLLINTYHIEKPRAHLEYEAETMQTLIMPDLMEMGHMNPWRWQHIADTFIKAGMAENDILLQGFIYDPDPIADKKLLVKYAKISGIVAIIASFFTLVLYLAYRSVKRENSLRIQTEKALQRSEERFKTMFNQAPLGIALIDSLSGHIYTANPMFSKIIGKTLEEMPTINWMNISHPDGIEDYLNNMTRLNTREISYFTMQKRYLHSDGSVVWTKMTIASLEVVGLDSPRHLCMLEDITEQKNIEDALRESESRFRNLYEKAPLAYQSIDNFGRILDVNDTWLSLLGYQKKDVINQSISDFISENSQIKLNPLELFEKDDRIDGLLCEFTCKNGNQRLLSVNGQVARNSMGDFLLTHFILTDVTEIMLAKNAAEASNHAKNQFLANLSHELRTPLNGILGFTRLLQKKTSLSAEDKKQIDIIEQCGDNLLTLITDLLDIASIESNKIKLHPHGFDFDALLNNIIDVFKLQTTEKKLELIIHNSAMPHRLRGDEKRIWQIIVNLLNNAIKYTEVGQVTVVSNYQDGKLNISIEDTGCGIAKENLPQIFSPFVQINTEDFMTEGVGLGLAITQELVNNMDGKLSVSSQLGVGSIFSVSLPLPAEPIIPNETSPHKYISMNKENKIRVIIADDNEINLLLLANLLELLGCIVDSAVNGKEALNLIDQNPYKIALIDLNMPVMSGLELVRILRNQNNPLKMVAISAYADNSKINEALAAGYDYYITKPIDEEQLNALINQAF